MAVELVEGPELEGSRHRRGRSVAASATLGLRLSELMVVAHQRRQTLDRARHETRQTFMEFRRLTAALGTVRQDPPVSVRLARAGQRRVPDGAAGEVERLHEAYAATGDPRIRERLFRHYDDFAVHLARRFPSRRESMDDLVQTARIGLLHAIDRFDPGRDRAFKGFAQATISGELKRHIRDRTWGMRVPRSLQEHYLAVMRALDDLTQERGRCPRVPEVAARCGLTEEHVLEAMELEASHRPVSLDAPSPDGERRTLEPAVIAEAFDGIDTRSEVASLTASLPAWERRILHLRFVENLTQAEIAERIGRSQMYVSRLLARTLDRMRAMAGAG